MKTFYTVYRALFLLTTCTLLMLQAQAQGCAPFGDQTTYGGSNYWAGYVYTGKSFNAYKGLALEGSFSSANFDETFGGVSSTAPYAVYNSCSVTPKNFSVRYKLTKSFTAGLYNIAVGGSDGYRLSLDGGSTFVINKWVDQTYNTTALMMNLSGSYNMVLEFYNGTSPHRITFSATPVALPIKLISFNAAVVAERKVQLTWKTSNAVNFDHFTVQSGTDAANFRDVEVINVANGNSSLVQSYTYYDEHVNGSVRYYRLAMVDMDGATSYSSIVAVKLESASGGVKIYPTVVESQAVFIEGIVKLGHVKAELFDMNGRRVLEKDIASLNGREQVSLDHLMPGAYIMRVMDASRNILEKQTLMVR